MSEIRVARVALPLGGGFRESLAAGDDQEDVPGAQTNWVTIADVPVGVTGLQALTQQVGAQPSPTRRVGPPRPPTGQSHPDPAGPPHDLPPRLNRASLRVVPTGVPDHAQHGLPHGILGVHGATQHPVAVSRRWPGASSNTRTTSTPSIVSRRSIGDCG